MRFQGTVAIVAALLAAALPMPVAALSHGTVVLVTDPAGDQDVTEPCLDPDMPDFDGVDVVGVALGPTDALDTYVLSIQTSGAVPASQQTTVKFQINKGPASLPGSTARGDVVELLFQGTTPPFGLGTVVTGADGIRYTFQPGDIHAVGGDIAANFSVEASDATDGALPAPITQDDCTASDLAPDQGVAGTFTFLRPPVAGNIAVKVVGGSASYANGTRVSFSGAQVAVDAPLEQLSFDVEARNDGLDHDTLRFTVAKDGAPLGSGAGPVALAAGKASSFTLLSFNQTTFGPGTHLFTVNATSTLGGQAQATLRLTVGAPPASERQVFPAGLAFLTPMANGLGLDGPLGSYAELALLLLILLLVVLVLFLVANLSRPWVKAHAEAGHVVAPVGGAAQVELAVDRVRRGVMAVRAVLRQAGWPATVGGSTSVDLPPDGRATLRVEVPPGAAPKDRQTVEVDLVPIGDDGRERPDRAAHTKVTVQAGLPSTPLGPRYGMAGVQLAGVRHDPSEPRPGQTVTTTATVRNAGAAPAPLRVALIVDGQARAENRVEVPPRTTLDVPLQWIAGAGANQVKVQVFLA